MFCGGLVVINLGGDRGVLEVVFVFKVSEI